MPFRYLEDIAVADVAFQSTGETLEEMFIAAAEALLAVMLEDPGSLGKNTEVRIALENYELDLLLFDFLAELIYYKDARQLLLTIESINVETGGDRFRLEAIARGETIDRSRHPLLVDVKAVTMHRLQASKTDTGWEATVVLDV
ncbi:MAG: archease [Geobacter sp.]|nr:archease [Geobacter sp.]